jgi:Ankyrin repeats (3 copies)
VLQQTLADFRVCCIASQRLLEVRRGVHSCVQAAAADRVAGGPNIWSAARSGDGASVLCHVIADADVVNRRDLRWFPPTPTLFHLTQLFREHAALHCSAEHGYLDICRVLLRCGARVNAVAALPMVPTNSSHYSHNTPLHCASYGGHVEVCRLLLQFRANLEAENISEQTPLSLAAQKGHTEVCDFLLERNADLEAIDSCTWAPLFHAVSVGCYETCVLLVRSRADLGAKTKYLTARSPSSCPQH